MNQAGLDLAKELTKDKPFWLALNHVEGLPPKTFVDLVKKFGSAQKVWEADLADLEAQGAKLFNRLKEARQKIEVGEILSYLAKKQIKAVTLVESDYPKNLLQIYDPPPVLYYLGELLPKDEIALAVVGSRRMTAYGREATQKLVSQLVEFEVTVVSGLARGIDAQAHQAALESGGRTIAVLGSGVDVVYPAQNRWLYERIINGGGVVFSEFPPKTFPAPFHFPQRNRIIAGLALGVLVVEAAEKSGSLITARFAIDNNREVFAVPGPIGYPTAIGTANLIKEGAKLVSDVSDILAELPIKDKKRLLAKSDKKQAFGNHAQDLPPEGEKILSLLKNEAKHVDQIVRESQLPASKVLATLSLMELAGLVKQLERGVYQISR